MIEKTQNKPVVLLASKSPRRRELLAQIGVEYQLIEGEIDESLKPSEMPLDYVERMALEKAQKGWSNFQALQAKDIKSNSEMPVVAADTIVVLNDIILGKPNSKKDACRTLKSLSGQTHQVLTSVALKSTQNFDVVTSISSVTFCELNMEQIANYVDTQECLDKAGSYGIQGRAGQFVTKIEGSYSGIVGLPLYETAQLLNRHLNINF